MEMEIENIGPIYPNFYFFLSFDAMSSKIIKKYYC